MKKKILKIFANSKYQLYGIIIVAVLLRLVNLNQSFWLDEAAQVMESIRPFGQQFQLIADFHPPLYHLILHFWMYFGTSEVWVRLPSLIFGTLSVLLIYKLIRLIGTRNEALLVSLFLAVSPFSLWYSQEARPYMLFVLTSLLSIYFLFSKKWIFYILSSIACLYSLYFAPFLFIGQFLYVLIFERKLLQKFITSITIVGLSFIPWLPSFIKQLDTGANGMFSGWTSVVSVAAAKALPLSIIKFIFGRGAVENHILYLLIILPVAIIFLLSLMQTLRTRNGKIICLLFFIPAIIADLISFRIPVIAPQRLIFILPFFYVLIVKGISRWPRSCKYLAVLTVLITSLSGVGYYYLNLNVQREQWRQAVNFVEDTATPIAVAVFVFPSPFAPYQWYENGIVEGIGIAPNFVVSQQDLLKYLQPITYTRNRIYLFQYLTGLTDPQNITQQYLKNAGFNLNFIKDFPGVGFIYIYDKK